MVDARRDGRARSTRSRARAAGRARSRCAAISGTTAGRSPRSSRCSRAEWTAAAALGAAMRARIAPSVAGRAVALGCRCRPPRARGALCADRRRGDAAGRRTPQQYSGWTTALSRTLIERLKFDPAQVTVLSETPTPAAAATAANVRRAIASIRRSQLTPRRPAARRADRPRHVRRRRRQVQPGRPRSRVGRVGGAAAAACPAGSSSSTRAPASFPFLERLAGPRRIVITATDSVAQRFDTVFPEYFIEAFADEAADIDKNGRISIWEAFACGERRACAATTSSAASSRPNARCSTTTATASAARPRTRATTASLASRTYLDEPRRRRGADRRGAARSCCSASASLEAEVEELKIRKAFLLGRRVPEGVRAHHDRAGARRDATSGSANPSLSQPPVQSSPRSRPRSSVRSWSYGRLVDSTPDASIPPRTRLHRPRNASPPRARQRSRDVRPECHAAVGAGAPSSRRR